MAYPFDRRRVALRPWLYLPAVLRFLRLQRYGRRTRAVVRDTAASKLQFPLQGPRSFRLLAALAYFALDGSARLFVYSPGWRTGRRVAYLPERDDHHVIGGIVARRRLDFRRVGGLPRGASAGDAL